MGYPASACCSDCHREGKADVKEWARDGEDDHVIAPVFLIGDVFALNNCDRRIDERAN